VRTPSTIKPAILTTMILGVSRTRHSDIVVIHSSVLTSARGRESVAKDA